MKTLKLDLNKLPIGIEVKTRKGFIWKQVKRGTWLDVSSGLTWLPIEPKQYTHHEAMALETKSKHLPTKADFEQAELHGIREVVNCFKKWFWSSSINPNNSSLAFVFDGGGGDFGYYDYRNINYSVRCVSRL